MAEYTKIPAAKSAAPRRRPLGAALAALWYLLVYTHLASYALAQFAPSDPARTCACGAMAGGSCCSPGRAAADPNCALPDEGMGCHGPRSAPSACLYAAPCGGELPATPQSEALTWPHLAAATLALQPRLGSLGLGLPEVAPCFSLLPVPPDKVPKQYS
ncbi:MAG: hypothetical protein IT369_23660 [Candidatus Latescibacteria bacterium]|nr:hypothetical protein [Candidatus Latescibacterota bacterium]